MENSIEEAPCPLAAVDQRLDDTHYYWKQAEESYFSPDDFRRAIQSTVQTLRSVTFVLQSHKSQIPNFDTWYSEWQRKMRQSSLLRWIIESRNQIEKRGDLELHSTVRVTIIDSHVPSKTFFEVPAELFDKPEEILKSVTSLPLSYRTLRNGVIEIERRWVENSLSDHELLEATAYAFGFIRQLVEDAHFQSGIIEQVDSSLSVNAGVPETMLNTQPVRKKHIQISSGNQLEIASRNIEIAGSAEEAKKRYGNLWSPETIDVKSIENTQINLFNIARTLTARDGEHINLLFMFRDRRLIDFRTYRVDDKSQVFLMMKKHAHDVVSKGCDAAIITSEIWQAQINMPNPYTKTLWHCKTGEGLVSLLAQRNRKDIELHCNIYRDRDHITLGKINIRHPVSAPVTLPFHLAWARARTATY